MNHVTAAGPVARPWARRLVFVGALAMVLGTANPPEGALIDNLTQTLAFAVVVTSYWVREAWGLGSLLIVLGSGLVALGVFLGGKNRTVLRYWIAVFMLIAIGAGAMFGLSTIGTFMYPEGWELRGVEGVSMWWGILVLPYSVGWLMAFAGGAVGLVRFIKAKREAAHR